MWVGKTPTAFSPQIVLFYLLMNILCVSLFLGSTVFSVIHSSHLTELIFLSTPDLCVVEPDAAKIKVLYEGQHLMLAGWVRNTHIILMKQWKKAYNQFENK